MNPSVRRFAQWLVNRFLMLPQTHSSRCRLLRVSGATVGDDVAVHAKVRVLRPSSLSLGSGSTINRGSFLDARGGLTIGTNVMIGAESMILSAGHDVDDPEFSTLSRRVQIGDGAVVFPRATIMPGVTVGRMAVILTSSVVTKDVPDGMIVGGNPATPVRSRRAVDPAVYGYRVWFAEI